MKCDKGRCGASEEGRMGRKEGTERGNVEDRGESEVRLKSSGSESESRGVEKSVRTHHRIAVISTHTLIPPGGRAANTRLCSHCRPRECQFRLSCCNQISVFVHNIVQGLLTSNYEVT